MQIDEERTHQVDKFSAPSALKPWKIRIVSSFSVV